MRSAPGTSTARASTPTDPGGTGTPRATACRTARAPTTRCGATGHGECPAGATLRRYRQALLLDVKEALVDEFVDAQRAQLAAKAGALGAAERQIRALACRGIYVG